MQTYTHLGIGAALGATLFPHDPQAQVLCIVASAGPDIVMVPEKFIMGKRFGRVRTWWMADLIEVTHSLPLLLLAQMVVSIVWPSLSHRTHMFVVAIFTGWIGHLVVDILTHGGDRSEHGQYLASTDVSYLWPLNKVDRSIAIRWHIWEYRFDHGVLWPPKPLEIGVLVGTLTYSVIRWLL